MDSQEKATAGPSGASGGGGGKGSQGILRVDASKSHRIAVQVSTMYHFYFIFFV